MAMTRILSATLIALHVAAGSVALAQSGPGFEIPPSALSPDNLARERPAAPFDLTGMWQHNFNGPDSWRFVPETFELTPAAQAHFDAGEQALAEGKLYRDDIGQCWPAGMPLIMTRVWPIAMIQLPTVIYMISHFMNSVRIIYLDGRPHSDPDIVVPSFNGESIGHFEGDTLVVDTRFFPGHHHWMDQGGASVPVSEDMHIVERIRLIDDGATLEIAYTMTDPQNWVGEWETTKYFGRQNDVDITEVECLPDLNENLPATSSDSLIRE